MKRLILAGIMVLCAVWMVYAFQSAKSSKASKPAANYGKYEFSYTTLDGKKVNLSDYAGKTVLVNIWAPWCGPCKLETPGFVKIYKEYKERGFEILSVAVNTNESDVREFMQKYGVQFPVGIGDNVGRQYGTYGIPDNYLFNPDGSLVKRFVGYTKEEVLRPLLEESLKLAAKTK
ncbi:MAG TPA: TlpA disulfide reductase family protein [Bacteroidota bacterium]|nr:TlpA disulfide reductase family protein [Bacteroidota bacterium]